MLLLATRNHHKATEICAILGVGCLTLDAFPDAPPLVEDADTFAGNAARKAVQLARWSLDSGSLVEKARLMSSIQAAVRAKETGAAVPGSLSGPPAGGTLAEAGGGFCWFVLADDSGLEVDALGGAPGVHSARFAALDTGASGNSSDRDNNAKLLRRLQDVPLDKRTARFRCVLALVQAEPPLSALEPLCFEGACEGRLRFAPSGQGGFGYDPLFVPEGYQESFAELGESVKNRISHRARALAKLRAWLESK
jgi:XTP/dITP diphosphohydrolase